MLHLGSRVTARATVALALVASAALTGIWGLDAGQGEASHAGGMSAMSIDLNTSGNTASGLGVGHVETLGALDSTLAVSPCDSVTLDVTGQGVPASNPLAGFGFTLNYNSAAIDVLTSDPGFLLEATAGSVIVDLGLTYGTNKVTASAADFGDGTFETGSGVLTRVTAQVKPGAAPAVYNLALTQAAHLDPLNAPHEPDTINNATLTVAGSCNGDVDCSITVNAVDALKLLRHNAGLSVSQTEPCADVNADIGSRLQGDVDCNGAVNAVDALKVLRAAAGLSVTQTMPCPLIDV